MHIRQILKKSAKWVAVIIATAIITTIVTSYLRPVLPFLPSEQPLMPNITSSPSINPIWNTADTQSVTVTATPDFQPPYSNTITVTIPNPNSYKCYMVLEFEASAGFHFLPISDSLPPNVTIGEGYQYEDVMKVYIKDLAPKFLLNLNLPVYTMNPSTFSGTEQITSKILAVQKE